MICVFIQSSEVNLDFILHHPCHTFLLDQKSIKKSRRPVRRLLRTAASRTFLLPPPVVPSLFDFLVRLFFSALIISLGA